MQKVKYSFPKFYICKYGAFYEGEELAQYCWAGGNSYYRISNVIIDKFFMHYYNYVPKMYFRFHEVDKHRAWTLPVEGYIGIFYRKLNKRY